MCLHKPHNLRRVGSASWAKTRPPTAKSHSCASTPRSLTKPFQFLGLLAGQPVIPLAPVGLILTQPLAERLSADPQLWATSAIVRPSEDYSVYPSAIGRRVDVLADLQTVTVRCAGRAVASHRRSGARNQSITDPDHRAAAEPLHQQPPAAPTSAAGEVEQGSLADYDTIFGLTEQVP
jgi:hypothetical protein